MAMTKNKKIENCLFLILNLKVITMNGGFSTDFV